jgi:hypothetical protein
MAPSPAGTTSYSVPVRILESGQEWSLFEEEVPREGAQLLVDVLGFAAAEAPKDRTHPRSAHG